MKVIRPTYPKEVSIGLLILIFSLSFFLAFQIFAIRPPDVDEGMNRQVGAFLISCAVLVMVLILWEEFLFPIHINIDGDEVIFRNHRSKLKTQMLIYLIIPVIFVFIYMNYDIRPVRFFTWAAICLVFPVAGKLISGIKNYNDFLKLTDDTIEYKNNEKEGVYDLKNIQQIVLIKDERTVLHKIQLILVDKKEVIIDLDEMELADFIISIEAFMRNHKEKELMR